MSELEPLGIQLIVTERHGMRRFLYPLWTRIPSVYRRSVGKLSLADPSTGALIPSHVADTPSGVQCGFALSMAPLETRALMLVRAGDSPAAPIPDPLLVRSESGERIVSRQERVEFAINPRAELSSVVYDGVAHLAGPIRVSLDSAPFEPLTDQLPSRLHKPSTPLYDAFTKSGAHGDTRAEALIQLTCCKSWAWVRHRLYSPRAGSVLTFTCPLTTSETMQTCDFGVGNGAYGRIQPGAIDAVQIETDLSSGPAARYRVRSMLPSGEARSDYAGEYVRRQDLAGRMWLHWNEPTRSLALAVTETARGTEKVDIHLRAGGVIEVSFTLGEQTSSPAEFGVCYHFLSDVPAVAAATNPASILCPPDVEVRRV